jgi:glycosyltransferase involved in cell wall biosynthesis
MDSAPPHTTATGGAVRFVYSGAVGGRYELDRAGRFLATAAEELGPIRLTVLTRADQTLVAEMLSRGGLPPDTWSVECLPHAEMPGELRRHQAGLFFLARGRSEHGCSPTKIGEYWACGLPVVTSPQVSDMDDIIASKGAGVVVADHSDESYRKAARQLKSLLLDPGLARRCREAAEEHYALDPAVSRQFELYERVLGRS